MSASVVGRSPETLSIEERAKLAGRWIATEIYTPKRLPLHLIEAIGDSASACASALQSRGLDPSKFEYRMIKRAY